MVSIAKTKLTKLTGQKNMKLRSNQQPTKITKLIVIFGALPAIIIAAPFIVYAASPTPAPSADPLITWTAGGKQSKNVDVLFVQNAKNMSFSEGKLVLRGVNPVTVCFTDRPARMAGHMQTSRFVPLWSQGKDSFLKDNPNATLSVFSGDNVADLVVELSNPQFSGDDLTYDAPPGRHSASQWGSLRVVYRCHRHARYSDVLRRCCTPCLAALGGRGK
jgi:hypothetical protein